MAKAAALGGLSLGVLGLPRFHELNLFALARHDALGQALQLRVFAIFELDLRHVHRALMMGDHVRHEIFVGMAGIG